MHDTWWGLFLLGAAAGLAVLAKSGIVKWLSEKSRKRLRLLLAARRKHDCGHWSESYATDPRTGRTECSRCYRTRTHPNRG